MPCSALDSLSPQGSGNTHPHATYPSAIPLQKSSAVVQSSHRPACIVRTASQEPILSSDCTAIRYRYRPDRQAVMAGWIWMSLDDDESMPPWWISSEAKSSDIGASQWNDPTHPRKDGLRAIYWMEYGGILHEFFRACGFCHIHDSPCLERKPKFCV